MLGGLLMMCVMNVVQCILYGYPNCQGCSIGLVVCLFIFIIFLNIGPSCISWEYTNELVPLRYRSLCQGIVCGVSSLGGFIGLFLFPIGQKALGEWLFLLFAITVGVGFVVLFFIMPESQTKRPEQIQKLLEKDWKSVVKVNIGSEKDN